jgi:hypothetical protein
MAARTNPGRPERYILPRAGDAGKRIKHADLAELVRIRSSAIERDESFHVLVRFLVRVHHHAKRLANLAILVTREAGR